MNERRLRERLRDAAPVDDDARDRAWRVVQAAYAGDEPRRHRACPARRRRRVVALAAAAALLPVGAAGVAAASAPDSTVGEWVRGVLGVGERAAAPALVQVPGGGRLLVQAGDGAWAVFADGAKRRLGDYAGAAWSPRGRFVIAWQGSELTALDPGGRVRWSLARAGRVDLARWSPVDGFRIAYLVDDELRIVNGDGTGDRRYGAAQRGVAPAWRPDDAHVVAYVDGRGRVNVAAVDTRRRLWRSAPLRGPVALTWSPDGRRLLASTRGRVLLFGRTGQRLAARAMPAGSAVQSAQWAPRGSDVALIRRSEAADRSEVLLLDATRELGARVLFTGPGRFGALAWAPQGDRLLIGWPDADQWLFLRPIRPVRPRGDGRLTAVANIAGQFTPGATSPPFPSTVQWCCSRPDP
jgi:hypothetical protein